MKNIGVVVLEERITSEGLNSQMIDELIRNKNSIKSQDQIDFFQENIAGKTTEEIIEILNQRVSMENIVDLLLVEETGDDGGIIALSGFYFQFLVSIEYLVELIEGKWDYLLIDHHQDIIAINKNQIRIIQVKTKNVIYCDVSDTKLYREWIQKLFKIDEMLNASDVKTEFELATNFLIKNSRDVEVEVYHYNSDFDMIIETNSFFDKVKHFNQQNNYLNLTNDQHLISLLSRFKISRKNPEKYLDIICSSIGSLFHERFKSTKEDIDFLIGYICSLCYYPENPSIQLINNSQGMRIKETLRTRFNNDLRQHIEVEDSVLKINQYITYLHQTFSESSFYEDLIIHIDEFDRDLKESINGENNIFSILSRFIERVYSSSNFDIITENKNIDELIKQLLDLTFFVKISTGGKVTIDSTHSKLLLKVIGIEKYNFFNLEDIDNYEDGIEKFSELLKICNYDEKRMAIGNNDLKLILSGDFEDEEFPIGKVIELDFKDVPTEEDMQDILRVNIEQDSIAKVTYKVKIVNGSNNIKRDLLRKRKLPNISEYENYVKTKMRWKENE